VWPMAPPGLSLKVRIARPSDARLVARLVTRSAGSRDYVLRILDEVIVDKSLFLAWNDDELVGMTHLDKALDGSGWLSMARTDPDWRRRGIALFLQQYVARYGAKRGLRALRLWTLATNTPAIQACAKGGFKPVCEAAHISCSIRGRRTTNPLSAVEPMNRDMLALRQSPYLREMNHYFAYSWYFVKFTRKLLRKLLRRGELYLAEESIFVLAQPDMSFGAPYCSFALLNGPAVSSLQRVRKAAAKFGRVRLGGYVPYNVHLLKRAEEAGFKRSSWANRCIVFEKRI